MAAGYGAADLMIGRYSVGQVSVTGVTAVPALSPRIRFGLSWTLGHRHPSGEANGPGDEYRVLDFGGQLRVGADALFVGTLMRDESWSPIRSLPYVQTQGSSVALDLGEHRLEQLEEHRAGGVLSLSMQLWCRIEMDGATANARINDVRFQVPRDDWLAVVGDFTGEHFDLLEVRYHLAYANCCQSSLLELRRAREAVDRGNFDSAVIQARKAVSLMEESIRAATQDDLKAALAGRVDEEHVKLYTGIVSRAKGMGNITAHRAEAREYTRVEALFAIRLATIVLEVVAGLLAD
ncbi:MAG: hypothetical protein OXH08_10450 [Gammaproteobacteria bacterium]|nr:hypothetical protein [Gammaproteobacteria bacterium]MDE2715461.1 hypothetical protein [Chloroflexota bacterium]